MSHSASQKRQKEEAMRDAAHHAEHATVDGSTKREHHGRDMAHESEEKMEHGEKL